MFPDHFTVHKYISMYIYVCIVLILSENLEPCTLYSAHLLVKVLKDDTTQKVEKQVRTLYKGIDSMLNIIMLI